MNLNDYLPSGTAADAAALLVVINGVKALVDPDSMEAEQAELVKSGKTDKKFFHKGQKKVMNKLARHNLEFGDDNKPQNLAEG